MSNLESDLVLQAGHGLEMGVGPMAEVVINSRKVAVLHNTPFGVQYSYRPNFTVPVGRVPLFLSIDQRLEHLREARKEAEAAMHLAKECLQRNNKICARQLHTFAPGDKVWLDAKDIKAHQKSRKLGPKRLGPFTVVKKHADLDYEPKLPPSLKVHRVFHIDCLSPWKGNDVNGVNPPPPEPIEIDEEEEYEVNGVLDSRFYRRQLQYLVSFKGYNTGHNMWLPHFNVHTPALIKEFHREHPNTPQRFSAALFWTLPW
jgi:hypothetical protein